MEQYTIKQTSELLQMPKDTLRYYDKLTLVSPKRGENRYRYYTEQDILDLQYIEILKYASFTLDEIQQFFQYKRSYTDNGCFGITRLFQDKRQEFLQKIKTYQTLITLIDKTLYLKMHMSSTDNNEEINALISDLFEKLRSDNHEE